MEASSSASPQAGWVPRHLTVWSGSDLVAAAPLYIKLHSAGEFVFDHAWAELGRRMGIAYYPKLVGMSPFTPMIGYRFLTAPEVALDEMTSVLLYGIDQFVRRHRLSGCHFLFVDPDWGRLVAEQGYCGWVHQSFAWENDDYGSFEDYLAKFRAGQRRNIRRERAGLDRQGIVIEMIPGPELPRNFFALMYPLYERTNDKFGPWGCKYLTPGFFDALADRYARRLLFAVARGREENAAPLGMSLLVTKGNRLYGRYWGSTTEIEFMHFNACYYAPIEWAIDKRIQLFDPGAGGGHKLRRGFRAVENQSLHRFQDAGLRQVMERHIEEINLLESENIAALNAEVPFRQPAGASHGPGAATTGASGAQR
jgi:predicted N-acyltransferase